MVSETGGVDSEREGYEGIIDLTLNRLANNKERYANARAIQNGSQRILRSLFPKWLLPAFRAMFARPAPVLSGRMIAFVTALSCEWLMGPCEVNNLNLTQSDSPSQNLPSEGLGVHIKRCRYLEESGCISVCINCCKIPTQRFFGEDMGVPTTITPNYDDFSCQFDFTKKPMSEDKDPAFNVECYEMCPTKRRHGLDDTCDGSRTDSDNVP